MGDNNDDVDDEVTLQEALDAQQMLEEQSAAVLGASDPQNCSYLKGYLKRQALYACLTCNPKGAPFAQLAGICLACSYTCHEGHDLVELFTKRNFRCDCGNKKFPDNPCRLQAAKDDLNADNVYSQNFTGLYCSCHRPYPDPDGSNEVADDSMIQCIICEDWLHFQHSLSHLKVDVDALGDFELICGPCMNRLTFLGHYSHLAWTSAPTEPTTSNNSSETSLIPATEESAPPVDVITLAAAGKGAEESKEHADDASSKDSGIASLSGTENSDDITATCTMIKRPSHSFPAGQAVAWKDTFRTSLCQCTSCMQMYESLKIRYLLDPEDTIEHYEALGRKNSEDAKLSAEETITNQVNSLGRVGQIELLHGYNQFKEQLAEFLKSHAEKGTVVQRQDVNNFFTKFNEEQAAKRRRLE